MKNFKIETETKENVLTLNGLIITPIKIKLSDTLELPVDSAKKFEIAKYKHTQHHGITKIEIITDSDERNKKRVSGKKKTAKKTI